MATSIKSKYNCAQAALYSVCDTLADNVEDYLADFTAFKGQYDAAAVTAYRAAIEAARNLPDMQARNAIAEAMRPQLTILNDKCMLNWKSLKRYIRDVFPSEEWKAREEEAGSAYYKKAAVDNWENTVLMNASANNFITANTVTLAAGGQNMPAGFPAQYAADALAYFTLYNEFKAALETGVPTEEKIVANNALYDAATEICQDGQVIFDNDAAIKDLFTWNTVLELIAPHGAASLRFKVVLDESDAPAVGANVKLKIQGSPVEQNILTDANGRALFTPLEAATYAWGVSMEGRHPEVGLKEINIGVNSRVDVRLHV